MDRGIFIVCILLSTLSVSLQEEMLKNTDYNYDDDYYDEPELNSESDNIQETEDLVSFPVKDSKELITKNPKKKKEFKIERDVEELTTKKPVAKYEVTEFVIDVPDVTTKRVPLITNFTLARPLNFAGTTKNITDNEVKHFEDEGDEVFNSVLTPNILKVDNNDNAGTNTKTIIDKFDINKDENDYFNIGDSKNSFEEEFDKEFNSEEHDFHNFNVKEEPRPSKGFRDHFRNFRKNIVNKFKSIIDKHKDGINESVHKIVNGPILFFSKLHRKSSDLAKKLHTAVSGHKFHHQGDDDDDRRIDHNFGDD